MIELCEESVIAEAEAKEFNLPTRQGEQRILVIKWKGQLLAYLNSCPHAGWPLNFQPDAFFNPDKTRIQCSNHMAMFDPATGACDSGPCVGDHLTPLNLKVENGKIHAAPVSDHELMADDF